MVSLENNSEHSELCKCHYLQIKVMLDEVDIERTDLNDQTALFIY